MKLTRYDNQGGVIRVHSDGTYVEYSEARAQIDALRTALESTSSLLLQALAQLERHDPGTADAIREDYKRSTARATLAATQEDQP